MIAKLIISPNLDKRLQFIDQALAEAGFKANHPDLLLFEDGVKLGVEQTKQIRSHLGLKPYSAKGRAVAIISSHDLTLDAQSSLLKTIEELPQEAMMYLGAESDLKLLPTILSRCQIHYLTEDLAREKLDPDLAKKIARFEQLTLQEKFQKIEKIEDKVGFLEALIQYYRGQIGERLEKLEYLKKLMEAERWMRANGNQRAILEYLMLEQEKLSLKHN